MRAEGREEEADVGLEAAEDGRTPEAQAMVLPLAPDEALVVNVARGLGGGNMVEEAGCVLVQRLSVSIIWLY